jgi:prophage regulatory protein
MSISRYVRVNQLTQLIPISKASVWRKVKEGSFPKPIKLGERITAWRMEDVEAWLTARHREVAK